MRELLRTTVGSQAYGLATPDSDTDTLAIHVLPVNDFLGIKEPNLTINRKDSEGDFCSHEIGKVLKLIAGGNPTVTELLFAKNVFIDTSVLTRNLEIWDRVKLNKWNLLAAKPVADSYCGYAVQQLKRLNDTGEFSSQTKGRRSKHGRHLVRLMLQGTELLSAGSFDLMLSEEDQVLCWEAGRLAEDRDTGNLGLLFNDLRRGFDLAYGQTSLVERVDFDWLNDLVVWCRS
jgi:uncharacterized protein